MPFYVCDEDGCRPYASLALALEDADMQIDICRDNCDPEWPLSVESIAIYEAPEGCEYPDEDGTLRMIATAVDYRDADDEDGVDFWCDYAMKERSQ